jgi:steroid 5-alpha reductase family enzyme
MLLGWLASLLLRDISVVDVAWGVGFVALGWAVFLVADGSSARKLLVVALTTIWGLRLSGYILWRRRSEEGHDFRYRELQEKPRAAILSLVGVFAVQAMGLWTVSLPLQAAQVSSTPVGLTALDFIGVAVWAIGMLFETVADAQLARFRRDPLNRGRVMNSGLWRYSRHPNYFGDFCVWWGIYLIALAAPGAWWTIAGPLMLTLILRRISGVPIMEVHLSEREGYGDYVRRTSAFWPLPPRATRERPS